MHVYEVRPLKDKSGVDLISDALPFGRLWYGDPPVIRVYDEAGNLIETQEEGELNVMLTYSWDPSASSSIGTPSHFAASLRSWNTRTLIGEP